MHGPPKSRIARILAALSLVALNLLVFAPTTYADGGVDCAVIGVREYHQRVPEAPWIIQSIRQETLWCSDRLPRDRWILIDQFVEQPAYAPQPVVAPAPVVYPAAPAPAPYVAPAQSQCRVIHEYPLKGLPEVATSGSHIHVEFYSQGQPEREVKLNSGRYRVPGGLEGFVWEYTGCTDGDLFAQIDRHIALRRAQNANNAGWGDPNYFPRIG